MNTKYLKNKIAPCTLGLATLMFSGCGQESTKEVSPNVILIMADDMGYEGLSSYGSKSYKTPNIDRLANRGIRFDNCISQPLSTPSRVKLMTGKYNFRNYEYFGYLNSTELTFGNLMKEAGYSTCIAGKWQLNGLAFKEIPSRMDTMKPMKFGFDEYCLWQVTDRQSRYSNPLIQQNGKTIQYTKDDYGPDIFCDYILDFIHRQTEKRKLFFVYYPMVLVHDPFVPTPDSKDWQNEHLRNNKDTAYFDDMISYMDKIVGRIMNKLKEKGVENNTLVMFLADNGTHYTIYSQMPDRVIKGGKGNTTDAGIHVPFIAYWPQKIKHAKLHKGLITFDDFYPTLGELVKKRVKTDGKSFLSLLTGVDYKAPNAKMIYYDPRWSKRVNKYRNLFSLTTRYKLYQDGKFYDLQEDLLEKNPILKQNCTSEQKQAWDSLQELLNTAPKWE